CAAWEGGRSLIEQAVSELGRLAVLVHNAGILRDAFIFFFQAEDGIRDLIVTGVQTCALPISHSADGEVFRGADRVEWGARGEARSEERRVGKEWRSRWARGHSKQRQS